jgi:hypothetical protein
MSFHHVFVVIHNFCSFCKTPPHVCVLRFFSFPLKCRQRNENSQAWKNNIYVKYKIVQCSEQTDQESYLVTWNILSKKQEDYSYLIQLVSEEWNVFQKVCLQCWLLGCDSMNVFLLLLTLTNLTSVGGLKFSQLCCWRSESCGMWRHINW